MAPSLILSTEFQNIHTGSQPGRSLDMILGPGEIESSLSEVLEDLSLISRTF